MTYMVTFYDPHPGLLGCPKPLPKAVKKIADDLDGCTLPLNEALNRIRNAVNPKEVLTLRTCPVDDDSGFIQLEMKAEYNSSSGWRVIRFVKLS